MPGERKVRVLTQHTLEVIGGDPTVADLLAFLAEKSPDAKVRVHKQVGDRPGELTVTRIVVMDE